LKKVFNQENLEIKRKRDPSINGYGNGDLLVHVNVWTPKTLNKDQKQFFEKHDG
jgi:molecular chaperone DnaJ